MINKLNKTIDKIHKISIEIEAIKNGAVINPETGKIVKDALGKILYYNNKKGE